MRCRVGSSGSYAVGGQLRVSRIRFHGRPAIVLTPRACSRGANGGNRQRMMRIGAIVACLLLAACGGGSSKNTTAAKPAPASDDGKGEAPDTAVAKPAPPPPRSLYDRLL